MISVLNTNAVFSHTLSFIYPTKRNYRLDSGTYSPYLTTSISMVMEVFGRLTMALFTWSQIYENEEPC